MDCAFLSERISRFRFGTPSATQSLDCSKGAHVLDDKELNAAVASASAAVAIAG